MKKSKFSLQSIQRLGRQCAWWTYPPLPYAYQNRTVPPSTFSKGPWSQRWGANMRKLIFRIPFPKKWLPSSGLSAWYLSLVPSLCFCSCGGFYINKMRQGPRTCQGNLLIKALGQNVKTSASAELISVLSAYLTWEFWENTQIPFLSLPLPSLTCHRITEW